MLPLNLYVYVNTLYGTNVVVPWATLAINIAVAIGATVIGLFIGAKLPLYRDKFNTLGNLSGIILIMMALVPQDKQEATGHSGNMTAEAAELHMLNAEGWCDGVFGFGRPAAFYMATAMPCFLGLFVALGAASLPCLGLIKEERVAISVETLYQNTGLALSIALSAFSDPCAVTAASGVPLFYGAVEALLLPGLLAVSWRIGWTYAPAKESCWVVVKSNYQPSAVEAAHRKLSVAESALELTKSQGGTAEQASRCACPHPFCALRGVVGARIPHRAPGVGMACSSPLAVAVGTPLDCSNPFGLLPVCSTGHRNAAWDSLASAAVQTDGNHSTLRAWVGSRAGSKRGSTLAHRDCCLSS